MSNDLSVHIAQGAVPATRRSEMLQSAGIVLAGSAFVALCSNRALPLYFTPVPLTLQPFAVLLLGLLLTPRMAGATLLTYLAEGALGLPVFAPSPQLTFGLAHLFGPTGGYLLAYPIAAPLISSLWRSTHRGFASAACSAAAGSFIILSCGAVWLAARTHASAQSIVAISVLPFLPGDALKIAAAAAIAAGYQRLRRQNA